MDTERSGRNIRQLNRISIVTDGWKTWAGISLARRDVLGGLVWKDDGRSFARDAGSRLDWSSSTLDPNRLIKTRHGSLIFLFVTCRRDRVAGPGVIRVITSRSPRWSEIHRRRCKSYPSHSVTTFSSIPPSLSRHKLDASPLIVLVCTSSTAAAAAAATLHSRYELIDAINPKLSNETVVLRLIGELRWKRRRESWIDRREQGTLNRTFCLGMRVSRKYFDSLLKRC